ncbi:MAG: hypothetical protein QXO21_00890 [Candidatus Anstonellales archaeon]
MAIKAKPTISNFVKARKPGLLNNPFHGRKMMQNRKAMAPSMRVQKRMNTNFQNEKMSLNDSNILLPH